jgi:hypothetical protein
VQTVEIACVFNQAAIDLEEVGLDDAVEQVNKYGAPVLIL